MGWSVTEDLLCVADDGTVMVYDFHGAIKKTLSMGQVSVKSFCIMERLKKKTLYVYVCKAPLLDYF